jgi:hypothetical protein
METGGVTMTSETAKLGDFGAGGPRSDAQIDKEAAAKEAATGDWFVRLYFEPDVSLDETMRYPDRDAAIDAAYDLAADFAAGDVDPRDVYQVPRPEYFDALAELTGDDHRETGDDH